SSSRSLTVPSATSSRPSRRQRQQSRNEAPICVPASAACGTVHGGSRCALSFVKPPLPVIWTPCSPSVQSNQTGSVVPSRPCTSARQPSPVGFQDTSQPSTIPP